MSFLVSANGQFSTYLHQAAADLGLHPVQSSNSTHAIGQKPDDFSITDHQVDGEKIAHIHSYQAEEKQFQKQRKKVFARDLMTKTVHSVQPETTVGQAHEKMKRMGYRHLPVIQGKDQLLGMLTERDLLNVPTSDRCDRWMKNQVVVSLDSTRVQEVAHLMLDAKLNAVLVIDLNHQIVGIITLTDILKFVVTNQSFFDLG